MHNRAALTHDVMTHSFVTSIGQFEGPLFVERFLKKTICRTEEINFNKPFGISGTRSVSPLSDFYGKCFVNDRFQM